MKILAASAFALLSLVALSSCSSSKPATGDDLTSSDTSSVVISRPLLDSIQVVEMETFPVQVHVLLFGNFPDGCTYLGTVTQTKTGKTFDINVTTHRPEDMMCTEALVPFQETVVLQVKGLKKGTYKVQVNDLEGSFTLDQDNEMKE